MNNVDEYTNAVRAFDRHEQLLEDYPDLADAVKAMQQTVQRLALFGNTVAATSKLFVHGLSVLSESERRVYDKATLDAAKTLPGVFNAYRSEADLCEKFAKELLSEMMSNYGLDVNKPKDVVEYIEKVQTPESALFHRN